ncbi:metallophosphoesterase family protein [Dictyobacter aurantiacus]|uniref:Serine/threonine protein phosphatase n=1 Tax=Dictyobacter aurantiacus TaxID=1936993 RepID=A0A401ZKR8_9CHLR|nr:metallophosphoesterase family protein [Dictyobacter aurantiacus]GCE07467.1 serine/threonine protein phosphatase [Dictyobacter aurantiacus]
MRIALIADIHGNLVALETVLRELARESIHHIICLGDVAALGPQPHEVIVRLRQLGCPVVLGNTDAWLMGDSASDTKTLRAITRWCIEQLTHEDRDYLRSFVPWLALPLDEGRTLLCYHGSPRSFDDVIAAVTPEATVEKMLAGHSAAVMVGGHTHIQMMRRYRDAHLVNVGSIGLPGVNAGSPELPDNQHVRWAEYGVLIVEQGRLSIDLRRIPLDLPAILAACQNSTMPHQDWWLQKWDSH